MPQLLQRANGMGSDQLFKLMQHEGLVNAAHFQPHMHYQCENAAMCTYMVRDLHYSLSERTLMDGKPTLPLEYALEFYHRAATMIELGADVICMFTSAQSCSVEALQAAKLRHPNLQFDMHSMIPKLSCPLARLSYYVVCSVTAA